MRSDFLVARTFFDRRLAALLFILAMTTAASAEEPAGAALYKARCARCHGKEGEGVKDQYYRPLSGQKSLEVLTRFVAKSMPKDKAGSLTPKEAALVTSYVFDAFYSPAAQARKNPARVELARLTVNQYRNAVADLVGSFRGQASKPATPIEKEPRGLRAEFFDSAGKGKGGRGNATIRRTDPTVDFDFGETSPEFAKLTTWPFRASWQGSVVPHETGMYDFIVHTEHSTRLWVNDLKKPLIDAFVKSGNDTEFKGSIFLLAGRPYSVKLDLTRGTVGVKKDPTKPPPVVKTTMRLEWKPPVGATEVIPERCLIPVDSPEGFVPAVIFPPDDRSVGYERGNAVSKAWVQAVTDSAIETTRYIIERLPELSGVNRDAKDRKEKLQAFCAEFAARAFRRPLSAEQKKAYVEQAFQTSDDPEAATKRSLLLVLQSPRFLYREPATSRDAFDVAARLSFALWDAPPDKELLEAAKAGKLSARDEVVRQAERMLADRKAHAKLRAFFWQWLKLDQVAELAKDKKKFPQFDPAVVGDLRGSLELFLDEVVWSPKSDFRQLLLDDRLYLNDRLAGLYGNDLPAERLFRKSVPKGGERAGVLTHPYLMAALAYSSTSSPIHRGVFVVRDVLGVALLPPPDAFTPLPPELHPNLTTRERIALQTGPRNCRSCHGVINPLGYPLESFDAIGQYRDQENGKPIDATGSYTTRTDRAVEFRGVRDLAKFLASSDEVHEAFVSRLFHYLVKQPITAFGSNELDELRRSFADNGYSIRRLTVEIAARAALADPAKAPRDKTAQAR